MALAFLGISLLGVRGRKDDTLTYRSGFWLVLIGLLAYLGSRKVFALDAAPMTLMCCYMGVAFLGYLLVLTGGVRLSRVISRSMSGDAFRKHNDGFQQEEQLRKTDFSLNLQAIYEWRGRQRPSYINFINARRGILIMGSPGSGKSWFLIEPMIGQLTKKGFALFVFDFKYPALSQHAYDQFLLNRNRYPATTKFYCINFTDLSRSHRCNVIAPESLDYIADAIGASRTILLSMNKTWVNRQGDFFVESPVNFLAALIWFLRKYEGGKYCTLPHAIELAQVPYNKLFTLLNAEPEIQTLIGPFVEAFLNKTMEMLDSQLSSARIPLGRLASPDLYYVLTGDDVSLDINDPAAPKILCLGGDPPRQEALAPILSLYIDRLNKRINRQGRYKCALVCDEFATVRAYSMTGVIATGRSNNVVPIIAVQDLSQLRTQYSRDEADLFLNIAGNLVCGQVGGETARWISERFPGVVRYNKTVSINSNDTSISRSEQTTRSVDASTIANLSSGEFVGIVADDPQMEVTFKAFHAKIVKENNLAAKSVEIPVVSQVDAVMIEANFQQIKREIDEMVIAETIRIEGDGALKRKVVKR